MQLHKPPRRAINVELSAEIYEWVKKTSAQTGKKLYAIFDEALIRERRRIERCKSKEVK